MSGHVTLGVLGWDTRWAEVWAAHHGSAADRVPARVVLEHQHIYEAIGNRRSDDARTAMRRHLEDGRRRYRDWSLSYETAR